MVSLAISKEEREKFVDPSAFAEELAKHGIKKMNTRKAQRFFAMPGFPRVFIGKAQYTQLGPALDFVFSPTKR